MIDGVNEANTSRKSLAEILEGDSVFQITNLRGEVIEHVESL